MSSAMAAWSSGSVFPFLRCPDSRLSISSGGSSFPVVSRQSSRAARRFLSPGAQKRPRRKTSEAASSGVDKCEPRSGETSGASPIPRSWPPAHSAWCRISVHHRTPANSQTLSGPTTPTVLPGYIAEKARALRAAPPPHLNSYPANWPPDSSMKSSSFWS